MSFPRFSLFSVFLLLLRTVTAWLPTTPNHQRSCSQTPFRRNSPRFTATTDSATAVTATESVAATNNSGDDDDDDDEYEYIEIDQLTETDFAGSEWLVGTNWNDNSGKIDETWVRCAVDGDGNNVAIWGDNSEGTWSLDVASGFFSASKNSLLKGKEIWATTAEDYYYMQGTVRGWSYLAAASVLGQWQARRLGVDPEEAGVAPWFEPEEEGEEETVALESTESEAKTEEVEAKSATAEVTKTEETSVSESVKGEVSTVDTTETDEKAESSSESSSIPSTKSS